MAQKQKSHTTKSSLMQDWVFRLECDASWKEANKQKKFPIYLIFFQVFAIFNTVAYGLGAYVLHNDYKATPPELQW